jgi:hypothetical protein
VQGVIKARMLEVLRYTAVESGSVRKMIQGGTMDRDIHRRNLERLGRVLKVAADESERKFILKLIRSCIKRNPHVICD